MAAPVRLSLLPLRVTRESYLDGVKCVLNSIVFHRHPGVVRPFDVQSPTLDLTYPIVRSADKIIHQALANIPPLPSSTKSISIEKIKTSNSISTGVSGSEQNKKRMVSSNEPTSSNKSSPSGSEEPCYLELILSLYEVKRRDSFLGLLQEESKRCWEVWKIRVYLIDEKQSTSDNLGSGRFGRSGDPSQQGYCQNIQAQHNSMNGRSGKEEKTTRQINNSNVKACLRHIVLLSNEHQSNTPEMTFTANKSFFFDIAVNGIHRSTASGSTSAAIVSRWFR